MNSCRAHKIEILVLLLGRQKMLGFPWLIYYRQDPCINSCHLLRKLPTRAGPIGIARAMSSAYYRVCTVERPTLHSTISRCQTDREDSIHVR